MKELQLHNIKCILGDCMDYMATLEDGAYDLAICDPEYGIGADKPSIKPEYVKQKNGKMLYVNSNRYKHKDWDSKPPEKAYFDELKRVSKNQIIWGANHFIERIPNANSSCWIVWDKNMGGDFADCELAWCSFKTAVRKVFGHPFIGTNGGIDRIHPTQKPVFLYEWILHKYAKEGDTILDTHFGSLSIGIACHDLKFDLTAIELDKDYYEMAKKRLINHQRQLTLF